MIGRFLLASLLLWCGAAKADDVDGRLTVQVRGSGLDIVLIPGLASSRDVWNSTRLDQIYRLHLVQLSGFAGLPPNDNLTGPILQPTVEALHHYIVGQKLKAPIIVGHSLGGLMALMLASTHPDDVGKLVIIDALPFYGLLAGPQTTAAMLEPRAAALRDVVLSQSQQRFAASEARSAETLAATPEAQRLVAEWGSSSDRGVVARAIYEDMVTDMRDRLPAITAPTLVLYPSNDNRPQTDMLYASAYQGLPNRTMQAIAQSRHFIPLDQPEAFQAAVRDFLDKRLPK